MRHCTVRHPTLESSPAAVLLHPEKVEGNFAPRRACGLAETSISGEHVTVPPTEPPVAAELFDYSAGQLTLSLLGWIFGRRASHKVIGNAAHDSRVWHHRLLLEPLRLIEGGRQASCDLALAIELDPQ